MGGGFGGAPGALPRPFWGGEKGGIKALVRSKVRNMPIQKFGPKIRPRRG